MRKKLAFLDTSLDDLRAFPESSRQDATRVNPYDWKPFSTIGPGVREIRTRDADGIYRVMYVAKFEEAVYVLHCFQKKTQTTSQSDIDLAKRRYKELVQERKNEN
ncbi:TPA: type II toxin-antitoxin system RelE/ParE family toxin [Escherichia coli]|nr:type II toxin-antitoxin system RelE/ParE family toxin [Escherichia coli]